MLGLLTVIVSFVGGAVVALIPASNHRLIRSIALLTSFAGLVLSLCCYFNYDMDKANEGEVFQNVIEAEWIPTIGAKFKVGYDGISLSMLILTGIVALCGVFFSWNIKERVNEFFAYYLVLIGGVYGVFLSMDLFLLFVFYEIAIIPKYFLISIWGSGKKEYAAMKLVLYSFVGSTFALIGFISIGLSSGLGTFDIQELMMHAQLSRDFQVFVFPLIFVGFAVLAGMVPFHTWAPTGHSAAPTAASMLLAGVVMKLGAYGCLRGGIALLPFGAKYWAPAIAVIAVINILYGALIAMWQRDFKYVIGYSSVSHMGFVILGLATLNAVGLNGAVLQMFSHGIIGAMLFAVVGGMIYERTHTRQFDELDQLFERMPTITWFFIIAGLASMGLPGFSGFMAEIQILIGTWQQDDLPFWLLIVVGLGILATFAYTLIVVHEAFFTKAKGGSQSSLTPYPKLKFYEVIPFFILLATAMLIGLFPFVLSKVIYPSLDPILKALETTIN